MPDIDIDISQSIVRICQCPVRDPDYMHATDRDLFQPLGAKQAVAMSSFRVPEYELASLQADCQV